MNRLLKIFASLTIVISCSLSQISHRVSWSNLDSVYDDLDKVQPYLINNSDSTIYFIKAWPFVTALTLRLNDSTQQWETGSSLGCCAPVANPDEPIDLKPKQRIRVSPAHASIYLREGQLMFMLEDSLAYRPIEGRYKLRMTFALEPWTVFRTPSAAFSTDSPEFVLVNGRKQSH